MAINYCYHHGHDHNNYFESVHPHHRYRASSPGLEMKRTGRGAGETCSGLRHPGGRGRSTPPRGG
eukprot:scaffold225_cov388-Prasinococcus_capsulatus_cf.AAC.41